MFAFLHTPAFRLQSALRLQDDYSTKAAIALSEEREHRQSCILECNTTARKQGITAGMRAAQAIARCPSLQLLQRSTCAEQETQDALVAAAFLLAPRVEATGPGAITLSLQGHHCQAQLNTAIENLRDRLQQLHLHVRIGLASTPGLARIAAHSTRSFLHIKSPQLEEILEQIPLHCAEVSPQLAELLGKWGIRSLGAFRRLRGSDVASKLPPEGAVLWKTVHARDERLLQCTDLPTRFHRFSEWDNGIETLQPLLFLLNRFTGELCLQLDAARLVATEIHLTLQCDDQTQLTKQWTIPHPTTDSDVILRMLERGLESTTADSPVIGVELELPPGAPPQEQRDLFSASVKNPKKFAETLAAVAAIVGEENAGNPFIPDTLQPDSIQLRPLSPVLSPKQAVITPATLTASPLTIASTSAAALPSSDGQRARTLATPHPQTGRIALPLDRFRPPLKVVVKAENDVPLFIRIPQLQIAGKVTERQGPWLLNGNWWDDDSRWLAREWDIQIHHQRLLCLSHLPNNEWVCHGFYG